MIKVISIPFDAVVAGFDDSEVREFTKDKQIDSLCHHYKESAKTSEAWRKILTESDQSGQIFRYFFGSIKIEEVDLNPQVRRTGFTLLPCYFVEILLTHIQKILYFPNKKRAPFEEIVLLQ